MKKTLILHGHFYQPPRETPDTGLLPIQESAYPKDNWNIRITDECYSANAYSRYLTYDGRIEKIRNNYEHLSFNFGPTLLHWIKEYRSDVYRKIIEADKESCRRLDGHGNALAQAYNHTILPLDDPEDARIQVAWGLEDFRHHFGREAEGIWLPETAVNETVLDILIEQQVKFIILSPWQAQRVETAPGKWRDLGKHPAPYREPYLLTRPKGEIAVFFYHPGLAEGISFGHFLRDAEMLYQHLSDIFSHDDTPLLHTATDGEIYGHHEPFGDMCLAALIQRIEQTEDITLGNYGSYLSEHPPKLRAELRHGEEEKGSSWSCFHGVSRWYKDCGCSTGGEAGWNQKWRTPLRKGFEHISRRLVDICKKELASCTSQTYQEITRSYGRVLAGSITPDEFAREILGPDAQETVMKKMLTLLEGDTYRRYMFTSCGWFFSDISGIEPKQNMLFALYAISLFRNHSSDNLAHQLEDLLHSAKSNIKHEGRGSRIIRTLTDSMLEPGVEAACFFVLNRELTHKECYEDRCGTYRLLKLETNSLGGVVVTLEREPNLQQKTFTVVTEFDRVDGLLLHCRQEEPDQGPFQEVSMDLLGSYLNSRLYEWLDQSMERVTDNDLEQIYHDMTYYTGISKQTSYQPGKHFFIANMGTCMRTLNSLFRLGISRQKRNEFDLIQALLDFIFQKGGSDEKETTNRVISGYLLSLTGELLDTDDCGLFSYIKDLLVLSRESGFAPDITRLQNSVYERLQKEDNPCESLKDLAMQAGISSDYS